MDFFADLDFHKIGELLAYRPEAPLIFSGGLFLFLFIAFLPVYALLKSRTKLRIVYVALFSLYFYYKSSGFFFLLLIFAATSDFLIGLAMAGTGKEDTRRKWFVILSVCVNLGVLAYFKYFNFLIDVGSEGLRLIGEQLDITAWKTLQPKSFNIFLPVGISFYTFQTMSYTIDIYRGNVTPIKRWIDYIFYVSFFPQLVAGPIVRARDFIPQIYRRPVVSRAEFGEALFLIIGGLIKKAVISDYISLNFVDRVFDQPLLYTGLENLLAVYGYTLQIYCDFSGYSDMAIGIALILGFRFNINFDSPYQSATITEFWRRWHISLSSWLKDYLYITLGGNRHGKIRTYVNLMVTMVLGGLWHGAAWRFVCWGSLHGVALALHKWILDVFPSAKKTGAEMKWCYRIPATIFTFHVVAFGWIYFRAADMHVAFSMVERIFTDFHPEILPQFISGYTTVFVLLVLGYVAHYTPKGLDNGTKNIITNSPFLMQALYLLVAVFIVFQFKSADVRPFIYFQF